MIEKKGIVENEEDMETSVYRDSCPDHDFNCITDYIGSRSRNTVLDRVSERVGYIEHVMNDGTIHSTFNEGHMKVEAKQPIV